MNYAAAHADRMVAMQDGRVVLCAPPHQAITGPTPSRLFGTEIALRHIDGVPVALHYGGNHPALGTPHSRSMESVAYAEGGSGPSRLLKNSDIATLVPNRVVFRALSSS